MASLSVLTFDHEGHPIQFDTWLHDLQLYLLSDSRDIVLLFDHTSRASLAPLATAHTFAIVEKLVTHLCTSDTRYCAALPAEFLDRNPPPMYITLNFIVTRLPDSLHAVRDHFLALEPTDLTIDLLEKHLLAAETSVFAVGAARGTPRTPFFEGCSPSPLAPSYTSAVAVDILGTEDVEAASALSGKRRSSKGKGGGGGSGGGGGEGNGGGGGGGGGGSGGSGGGSGGFGGGCGGSGGGGGGGGGGSGSGGGDSGGRQGGDARGSSSSIGARPLRPSCFLELLRSGVDIFALDSDAILAAMYALSVSAEGDYYLCVPPDPGIEAPAPGAGECVLPGTAPAEALHTFTLDSGASRCFFRDSTTLTPLPAPVPVRLADPSDGPNLACSSTVLPCPAVPSGLVSGLHLPSFSTNLVSTAALPCVDLHVYTDGLSPDYVYPSAWFESMHTDCSASKVAASAHVSALGPVAAPYLCRLLLHQTLLWHHRLGHPPVPRLHGMHSRLLLSGLLRSLPPLPPSPAPPCLPCVEGQQCVAPHSFSFPPTTAPLQTLHMDVWGLARISEQDRDCYFLLVVDDYTRYMTVFPLRSKSEELPVLRLHSDTGGEFSSDLLWDFCCGEGILQPFTLLASLQQNGVAERRIGLVMEVARASMILAAAPHFLWPFATSHTLRWTGKVGDALVFRVWGSCAFDCDTSADKLSSRAIPCVFLGFSPDVPGWQFYLPTSRHVLPSQDVMFDELVPHLPSLPLPHCPSPPLAAIPSSRPPSGAARGAAFGGAAFEGAEPASAEPGGAESEGAEPGGAESEGAEPGGAETEGAEPGGAEPRGSAAGGTKARGAGASGPGGARTSGTGVAGAGGVGSAEAGDPGAGGVGAGGTRAGGAGASSPRGAGGTARAGGTRGAGAAGPGGARTRGTGAAVTGGVGGAGAGGTGAGDHGAGGARAGGAGAGVARAGGTRSRGARAGGTDARSARAGGTRGGDLGAGGAGAGVLELAVLVLEALYSGSCFLFRRRCRLCRRLTRSFARFLVSRLLLALLLARCICQDYKRK
ncbi:unnamed protein product [Closterium sp. NIES-53]